jgi:pyruvate/2-oxoglutarate/acetoin dehydrogenase E1 component
VAKEDISIEVLDLRSLVPLDRPALLESVGRTGRALIVHSGIEFGGFGAEIGMILQSALHGSLKKPVGRVGARYTPVPFAASLDVLHYPTQDRILAGVRKLLK